MKTALLTLLLMTSVSAAAMAADKTDGKSGSFAVERMICSKIYVPSTGKASPTYQAGVDVNGNAVAPADLAQAPTTIPDYIEVPMTIDLAQKMGTLPQGAEMKLPAANLKLYKNGKVEYNGQDISSNAAGLCGYAKKSDTTKSPSQVEPAAGQDQMTVAPSLTSNPEVQPQYPTPPQPEDIAPQAGSVAASTTTPAPKIIYKLQQGTANRSPYPVTLQK